MFRSVFATVLLTGVLGVLLPPAAAPAREPTPLEVFERYYRDRSASIRKKAVAQLSAERGANAVRALLEAVGDEDGRVRVEASRLLCRGLDRPDEIEALHAALLGRKTPPAVRLEVVRALAAAGARAAAPLQAALADRQVDVRRAAARALGSLNEGSALPALHEALADRDALVRAAACESIGWLRGPDAVGAATAVLAGDGAHEPQVAAATILGRFPRGASVDHLARRVGSSSWSVRVACASALGAFARDTAAARSAAAALVPALAREPRRRVREEQATALYRLTGIDFGPEPDRWTAWFEDVGTTFTPPEKPPKPRGRSRGSTSAHLLALPLGSEHVSFVIDGSHSMNDPIRFGAETTKRKALCRAFEDVVNRLPKNAHLNLITFGTEPKAFKEHLFAATRAARRSTVRYLEKRAPDGRTNIYDALELALGDPAADTIVLVTDGAPSAGARRSRGGILAGLRDLNRYRLARVHTVEIGAANTGRRWRGFMAEIAEATGGHYLER